MILFLRYGIKSFQNIHTPSTYFIQQRLKTIIDKSQLPVISENDLDESFVRGSGPGGSAVNKNSNCVVLKHKPSGIVIKCHLHRDLQDNRREAREMLVSKLDDMINGTSSVSAQKKEIVEKKFASRKRKQEKRNAMKELWRKSNTDE